jgi:hypothetical protein
MTKIVLLCSASALAFGVSGGALAGRPEPPVTHAHGEVHRIIAAVPGSVTLYDQNSDDSGVAVPSENFTHDFESYDSSGADDFTVPAGHTWKIREVEVTGVYGQPSNPADSENVFIYKDRRGLPENLVAECDSIKGIDNQGSFAIKLPKSCKVNLKGGKRYWISVVANENNACCTSWFWETRNGQNAKPAVWKNPGGGYGTGCEPWEPLTSCFGNSGEGPDFMFALKGKDIVQ